MRAPGRNAASVAHRAPYRSQNPRANPRDAQTPLQILFEFILLSLTAWNVWVCARHPIWQKGHRDVRVRASPAGAPGGQGLHGYFAGRAESLTCAASCWGSLGLWMATNYRARAAACAIWRWSPASVTTPGWAAACSRTASCPATTGCSCTGSCPDGNSLTSEAWLQNMDRHRAELQPVLARACGAGQARRWWVHWRVFFISARNCRAMPAVVNGGCRNLFERNSRGPKKR
jgi:hypothetical protein